MTSRLITGTQVLLLLHLFILPQYFVFCRTAPVSSSPPKKNTFEGDIELSKRKMKSMQNEILFTGKVHPVHVWKDGVIPFEISEKFNPEQKDLIMGALQEISGETCIHFVQRSKEKDYLSFIRSEENRCSSKVGRIGGRQEIQMSASCMRHGTVVHELLHALGLYHEQSRPDRDRFIKILWENLKSAENRRNFEKYWSKFLEEHMKELPYDYSSIMHYSSEAFSKQWGKKTIVPMVNIFL